MAELLASIEPSWYCQIGAIDASLPWFRAVRQTVGGCRRLTQQLIEAIENSTRIGCG
jgi:hypothetical protein